MVHGFLIHMDLARSGDLSTDLDISDKAWSAATEIYSAWHACSCHVHHYS